MAYHDDQPGFTPIIVGREYVQFLKYPWVHKLLKVNEATGYCVLRTHSRVRYISITQLSNWHICPLGK